MSLDDRVVWFLIGGFVGFLVGYNTNLLFQVKAKLEEINEAVKAHRNSTHEEQSLLVSKQGDEDERPDADKDGAA